MKLGIWIRNVLLVVILVLGVGMLFLPQMVEKLIYVAMSDLEWEQKELHVSEVGWNKVVLEDVSLVSSGWAVKVKRLECHYQLFSFIKGKVDKIILNGAEIHLNFEQLIEKEEQTGDLSRAEKSSSVGEKEERAIKNIFKFTERIGLLEAKNVLLVLSKNGGEIKRELNGRVWVHRGKKEEKSLNICLEGKEFKMNGSFWNGEEKKLNFTFDKLPTIPIFELVSDLSRSRFLKLPRGIKLGCSKVFGCVKWRVGELIFLRCKGDVKEISYTNRFIQVASNPVIFQFEWGGGRGTGKLSGEFSTMRYQWGENMTIGQKRGGAGTWQALVSWDGEKSRLKADLSGLEFVGEYKKSPLNISANHLQITQKGGDFILMGSVESEGVTFPVRCQHHFSNVKQGGGTFVEKIKVGPVKGVKSKDFPVLPRVSKIFDSLEVGADIQLNIKVSVNSSKRVSGVVDAQLKNAELLTKNKKLYVSGMDGGVNLSWGKDKKNGYKFNFLAKKCRVDAKGALGVILEHKKDSPIEIDGSGNLDDEIYLTGGIKGLDLCGEKNGERLDWKDAQFYFELQGEKLTGMGNFKWSQNIIPFSYEHLLESDKGDGWKLRGKLKIKHAEIKKTLHNVGMIVSAMNGMPVSGDFSMKMDYLMAKDQEFDASLDASLVNGTLKMPDDGPRLEGIYAGIHLDSLNRKATKTFHRVKIKTMEAWDMKIRNISLDYQLRPNGNVRLKNMSCNALGGTVTLDPFVFPKEGTDYQIKIRAKMLDLKQVAKLFPDFNGTISGRIDGFLPMAYKRGQFVPGRGGLYLSPRRKAKLCYDAGDKFSKGKDPRSAEYQKMKMLENSLRDLDLQVLSVRLFDPRDKEKAIVLKLKGQAKKIKGAPPIILNINGFKPDDKTVNFFDLLLRHRDKLKFGL